MIGTIDTLPQWAGEGDFLAALRIAPKMGIMGYFGLFGSILRIAPKMGTMGYAAPMGLVSETF